MDKKNIAFFFFFFKLLLLIKFGARTVTLFHPIDPLLIILLWQHCFISNTSCFHRQSSSECSIESNFSLMSADISPPAKGVDHRHVQKELGDVIVRLHNPMVLSPTTIQVTWTVSQTFQYSVIQWRGELWKLNPIAFPCSLASSLILKPLHNWCTVETLSFVINCWCWLKYIWWKKARNRFMIAVSVTCNQHGKTPAAIWRVNQKSDFLLDDKWLKRTKKKKSMRCNSLQVCHLNLLCSFHTACMVYLFWKHCLSLSCSQPR